MYCRRYEVAHLPICRELQLQLTGSEAAAGNSLSQLVGYPSVESIAGIHSLMAARAFPFCCSQLMGILSLAIPVVGS